jgi:hypothetical protein
MAITITRADVKRKCMIPTSDTTYDSAIDSSIAEMQPAIEHSIADEYLSNTGDTDLQAALKLGILELISAEFLEQMTREAGAAEQFAIGGLTIGERKERGADLRTRGTARLDPYLKAMLPMMSESDAKSTTLDAESAFDEEETWP